MPFTVHMKMNTSWFPIAAPYENLLTKNNFDKVHIETRKCTFEPRVQCLFEFVPNDKNSGQS